MAKRTYETTDYAAMMKRMIAAHGRRVADGDVEDLAELLDLQEALNAAIAHAVQGQRQDHGRSWADIARAAGTSRQAAQKRWSTDQFGPLDFNPTASARALMDRDQRREAALEAAKL